MAWAGYKCPISFHFILWFQYKTIHSVWTTYVQVRPQGDREDRKQALEDVRNAPPDEPYTLYTVERRDKAEHNHPIVGHHNAVTAGT